MKDFVLHQECDKCGYKNLENPSDDDIMTEDVQWWDGEKIIHRTRYYTVCPECKSKIYIIY